MKELIEKTIQWMEDRNFFGEGGATIESQTLKFFEEYGEYCGNKLRGKDTMDDCGDQLVVSIALIRLKNNKVDIEYLCQDKDFLSSEIPTWCHSQCYHLLFHAVKNLAIENGYTPKECLEHAYNEIKDRKGRFIDGAFVKESDLELNTKQ